MAIKEEMFDNTQKAAKPDYPIVREIARRYSPYVFEPKSVDKHKLLTCLDAARWAASSFNEQPWAFYVSFRADEAEFRKMLGCLAEPNQGWAANAGVLMLTAISRKFSKNNKPNRVAEHDLGLAMGNFTMQATALGLAVHQMAGVDLEKIRTSYDIPKGWDPMTAVAVGYAGDPNTSENQSLAERDRAPRSRKPFREFVFGGGLPI